MIQCEISISQIAMCVCHGAGKAISAPKGMVPSVLWPPCCLAITVQLLMYLFVTQTGQDQVPSLEEDSFSIWNASRLACAELSDTNIWEHFIHQSSEKPSVRFTDSQKSMWFYWNVIISILFFVFYFVPFDSSLDRFFSFFDLLLKWEIHPETMS